MAKQRFNVRVNKEKLKRLSNIARDNNTNSSELVRSKIDELLNGDFDITVKNRVKKIIKDLNEPFVYAKSQTGIKRAVKERAIRQRIIKELKKAFKL